jgi:glutamate synthase (NADPH/NADH) large chain
MRQGNTTLVAQTKEINSSACGVGMIATIPNKTNAHGTHQLVRDGLKVLADFEYRSGYNLATEESDGSGIKFFGLSPTFFNKKIKEGDFIGAELSQLIVTENQFAIGQYFFPTSPIQLAEAKALIETCAKAQGLLVVGWRNLDSSVEMSILSTNSKQKKPAMWQSIIIANPQSASFSSLEEKTLKMGLSIAYEAREKNVLLNIVSLSSESIIYKGMLRSNEVADFYRDLSDETFTATAIMLHSRFATNTDPQWSNAQPCVYFWAHNGELNSAPANAIEMSSELTTMGFKGVYPNDKLSDSMQFDADLANQMIIHGIKLDEAMMRLMSSPSENYSAETNAMLKYWSLHRTAYNGPAFAVAGMGGHYMAKLDNMGLRPSRWAITEDQEGNRRFYAASDDFIDHTQYHIVLKKGHLEPGGMIMLTPEGELLDTKAILTQIAQRYHQHNSDYFQHQLKQKLILQPNNKSQSLSDSAKNLSGQELQRALYSAGWDYESESQCVRFMAENGYERTGAMGDDTNILHTSGIPAHISYFFHQLFAQVSAPPLDSIKERDRFSLTTFLGGLISDSSQIKQIEVNSPILEENELPFLEQHPELNAHIIDICFLLPPSESLNATESVNAVLRHAIQHVLNDVEKITSQSEGGLLILSDRNINPQRVLIPDLIAVAAVRRFLEIKNLDRKFSIIADSYQITGPHQATVLLALGAKGVYPRGSYAKIKALFPENTNNYYKNYREALQKCLLKTMGKMGLTDVNNYINGGLVAALGLDLSPCEQSVIQYPSLASIFPRIYSPLKGINLGHIAHGILVRHQQAYDPNHEFTLLPRSGYYMPEKNGIKHGFGPVVVNAFTEWMKEEDLRAKLFQMHLILERKGHPNFINDLSIFSIEQGFLDPRQKNAAGFYPPSTLDTFTPSRAFRTFTAKVDQYRRENPTSLHDYFTIEAKAINAASSSVSPLQSQQEIRSLLFAGSMSQGALTVTNPKTPDKLGAHETLTRGMNAIGAKSASGEGGESPLDIGIPLHTTASKQFASGRFGISVEQILNAEEIEIKVAQGAKPGEGGELPGSKVSIRFAAQRGGLPNVNFISPPPHHDIYSIEDLEQLIHDIKSVNPQVKVAVKLVASLGIGTIAVGVAKAGADVINIASNSGGTGAAQQSSIKHTGLPSELGLAEVDRALRKTELRDLVKLRVSGGFKTAEEVILAALLGADLFEFGTAAMLTLGCKMQRTCNQSCQPGVAIDGHLFKGDQINTERYFVNLAAAIQERLKELGFGSLAEIRGRTDLLIKPQNLSDYDFTALLDRSNLPEPLSEEKLNHVLSQLQKQLERPKEQALLTDISGLFAENKEAIFSSKPIELTTQDRSFGARITGTVATHLKNNPSSRVILNTTGNAGQSFGFVNSTGMIIKHTGTVQDGCAKSMTGGELILCTPNPSESYLADQNTIAGNAMLYGASGGHIYVNGQAGHRFGILMKGAEVVVEGVGDLAFEYMTSGTGMILGKAGPGLGAGSSGGIIFVYDPDNTLQPSSSVRLATEEEQNAYAKAIQSMLKNHRDKTNSLAAKEIIQNFNLSHFKVIIPKEMDKISSLAEILDVLATYKLRNAPLTKGMQVWLEQKTLNALQHEVLNPDTKKEFRERLLQPQFNLFSSSSRAKFIQLLSKAPSAEHFDLDLTFASSIVNRNLNVSFLSPVKKHQELKDRLIDITGSLDVLLLDALKHIQSYVAELSNNAEGCSGCRAQSCAGGEKVDTGCPSGKGINTINALLKQIGTIDKSVALTTTQWNYLRQAFTVQIQESPFIAYTGAACPAPCQDACTETIPDSGTANLKRGGKLVGEHVHIKDIEYYLYQIGRSLDWFEEKKIWNTNDIQTVFGDLESKQAYDSVMQDFKPPFRKPAASKQLGKELIIIGSGPAAMQMAYKALLDGVLVRMYEKSDKPGGLLADGIPAHKFDKAYLTEDFDCLQRMGLQLHLNSDVFYDEHTKEYRIKGKENEPPIASAMNENQYIALCIGAGLPKKLPPALLADLPKPQHKKLIQAVDFLKAANDVANELRKNPSLSAQEKDELIKRHFAHMDPRHKKIVVIGGGDTAQDVIRWVARYFNQESEDSLSQLNILIRGPKPTQRAVLDSYPASSRAPTHENELKKAEVEYVQGTELYLAEPTKIQENPETGTIKLQVRESRYKYAQLINKDSQLKELFVALPRELRVIDPDTSQLHDIEEVDLIICALGFEGNKTISLVESIAKDDLKHVYIAGDAAGTGIIVAAQDNANKIYGQIRTAMGITNNKVLNASTFFSPERPFINPNNATEQSNNNLLFQGL